jgi:hypothetical protein
MREKRAMSALVVVFMLSAMVGFALGISFSCCALAVPGIVFALLSAAVLHVQGFGAVSGIAITVACLIVNQLAYLAGVFFAHRRLAVLSKK